MEGNIRLKFENKKRKEEQIMNKLSQINDLIHDSTIFSYTVDFDKHCLHLNTRLSEVETSIKFAELLAHKFDEVIDDNIVFEIFEATIEEFIESEKKYLLESIKYGFPSVYANSIKELESFLIEKEYKVFELISSLGMTGYIIAKDISIDYLSKCGKILSNDI